ncbi:unnamed protein product [Effrenium voratum]|uniref:Uncharacterized protein n=1 Tax=Effrenium voratum TaxID=2562239 RepID=A0AA36JEJ1_9DINO|nr:unnamed protein product [Effrenium voratum]CAJ1453953.1 unnamed protein product [Effrenium voratum]
MALYTALEGKDGPSPMSQIVREASEEFGELTTKELAKPGKWHGVLYGFWPTLCWTMLILGAVVDLNLRWAANGSLGFSRLDERSSVLASPLGSPEALLLTRAVSLLLTVVPCILAVIQYRKKRKAAGEPLVLGGLEILMLFCTLWTWCWKTFYFFLATSFSAGYVVWDLEPPLWATQGLWLTFDIAFGMAWLVFWAVWLFLLPFSWLSGHKEALAELLSPLPFYLHNANVVLVTLELVLSQWTVNIEHSIFPVYFAFTYLYFNWWLYSKIGVWIYFFLDYDRPSSVPVCLMLCAITVGSFDLGGVVARAVTR